MTWAQDTLDDVAALSRSQRALRAVMIAAPLAAALATAAAGDASAWFVATSLVLVLVAALRPDSHAAFAVAVVTATHWLIAVDAVGSPWVLLAAGAMLVLHTATAAATTAPPSAEMSANSARRWSRRAGVVLAGTIAVWAAMRGFESLDPRGNVALAVVGAAAAGGIIGLVWPRERV